MNSIFKKLRGYLLAGTFVLLPVVLSIWLFIKLFLWLNDVFPSLTGIDLPVGVGPLCILTITILTGIVSKNYIGRKLIRFANTLIASIPVLNKVFLVVQQIMDVMFNSQKNLLGEVVLVEYPKEDSWCLGFVTSRETPEISGAIGYKTICVYVPTTPNPTSGFMLYVPESKTVPVDMSPELAIKAIVSAGIVSSSTSDLSSKSQTNFGDIIRKWKNSRATVKEALTDPRD